MSRDTASSIGAVARITGLSVRAIRYYEDVGLIGPPSRHDPRARTGGNRRYDAATIERLQFIRQARTLGLSLSEIRELGTLLDQGTCPGGAGALHAMLGRHREAIQRHVDELQALQARIEANLVNWFVMLWWFTALVFALAAAARWWLWRRWAGSLDALSLPGIFALGATASWRGDWEALSARFARAGDERRFAAALTGALVLPVYTLLMIFAFGKEYLLIYLVAVAMYAPAVITLAGWVLRFPQPTVKPKALPDSHDVSLWRAPLHEFAGVGPRFVAGLVLAAILAAVAIQPQWAFPVEITGGGFVAQVLNALVGLVLAIGAWTPPVGAFLFGVPVWRGGFALAELLTFLLAIPATPYVLMVVTAQVGRRQAGRLAALVITASLVAALVATALVALVEPALPYLYTREQLL